MTTITKKDVIRLLETIATYLELKGENSFKIAAYRKAANGLEKAEEEIHKINDFTKIPGIGKGTAAVIEQFLQTGKSEILEKLKEEIPTSLITLLQIPGLGGKKVSKLYNELHIQNVDDLKEACRKGLVRELAGFGKKTEEKLLAAIENNTRQDRLPIAYMNSGFTQPKEKIMTRLTNALKNSYVHIIAHPTGRKIGIRDGYTLDMDDLLKLAKETNTALELNANPNRLDLNAKNVEKAQKLGVKIVINTDAHSIKGLQNMSIGVQTARKGWLKKESVLNAGNINALLSFLKRK